MPRPTYISTLSLAAAALSLLGFGCSAEKPDASEPPYGQSADTPAANPSPAAAAPADPADADAPVSAGGPGGPMMGGMGDPNAPLTPTPELDRKIEAAEKGGDKKAIAAAYAERGYARMTDDGAGARTKYRAALEDFREALERDPANAQAKENKEMIENIYRSMGRPVPGEEGTDATSGAGEKSIGFPMGESKKPE